MTFSNDDFSAFDLDVDRPYFRIVFPDNVFGEKGKFFFPGTFDQAEELIEAFSRCRDKEFLFRMYYYPFIFKDKIRNC